MSVFVIGNQPCNNFKPEEGYMHMGYTHQCPKCGGERVFCMNCYKDHHAGGWDDCWKIQKEAKNVT